MINDEIQHFAVGRLSVVLYVGVVEGHRLTPIFADVVANPW